MATYGSRDTSKPDQHVNRFQRNKDSGSLAATNSNTDPCSWGNLQKRRSSILVSPLAICTPASQRKSLLDYGTGDKNPERGSQAAAKKLAERFESWSINKGDSVSTPKTKLLDGAFIPACTPKDEAPVSHTGGSIVEPGKLAPSTPLDKLLRICKQKTDINCIPSIEEFFLSRDISIEKLVKVGEGTYGEAFRRAGLVFKLVPLEGSDTINDAMPKRADEMLAEVTVALTLSQLGCDNVDAEHFTGGFIQTLYAGVCNGPYPELLIDAWYAWDEEVGSENDAPDTHPEGQHYLVMAMQDGGKDLEQCCVRDYDQARSLLAQVAMTLAVAEAACEFEHRDLHWGNMLVRETQQQELPARLHGKQLLVRSCGVAAVLIDFTAARLISNSGEVAFCDLAQDPELFEGPKGSLQFDTYRLMRTLTQNEWGCSCPATNCAWLAYLADVVAREKLKHAASKERRELREFRKRALSYGSCQDMLQDPLLADMWRTAM